MKVLMQTGGLAHTNCFVVADETSKQAVLFDAPDHTVGPLLTEVREQGWDLIGLWLTHGHFDHIADHAVVTERFPNAKVLIHPLDELKLARPELQLRLFPLPFVIPARKADAHVSDNQILKIGSIDLQVLHTPGHAPGHVMYHIPGGDQPILIGGDLIIGGAVGRTDFPDSSHHDLNASIRRVMQLPGHTTLLGGHGGISTLDDERTNNPYVQEALRSGD
jgi:glyoxylase-like metal-dependent hydrolase (beta-lactamase superfamily II)